MVENIVKKCYICNICDKQYKDKSGLWYHNNKFHSNNTTILPQNTTILPQNTTILPQKISLCQYCNKELSRYDSLKRHISICKEKQKKDLEKSIYIQELEKLKKELEKVKKQKTSKTITYNINNGSINSNNTNSNNTNSNNKTLNICDTGKENVKLLTDTEKDYIMSQGMNSIVSLVEYLNFNNRLPGHHNFYTSSINDKYVNTLDFNTNSVVKKSKKDLFDQILLSHMNKLESLGQNNKKFNEVLNKLKAFIYVKKGKKEFINQVNMLSYNKRNMVISTWNKLIDDSSILPEDVPEHFENEVKQIALMSEEDCINDSSYMSSEDDSSNTSSEESDEEIPQLVFGKKKRI